MSTITLLHKDPSGLPVKLGDILRALSPLLDNARGSVFGLEAPGPASVDLYDLEARRPGIGHEQLMTLAEELTGHRWLLFCA